MSQYIPNDERKAVKAADEPFCAYCRTSRHNTGQPLTYDHILPRSKGGHSLFDNLCRACRQCNEYKADKTEAIDRRTGEATPLFHPRQNIWEEHFQWSADGIEIIGLTAIGRATVYALQMNNPDILFARQRWVAVGWHPPS